MNHVEKPAELRLSGLSEGVRLAAEPLQNSPSTRSQQVASVELASRRHDRLARRCEGALAKAEAALAEHYGRVHRQIAGVAYGR